MQQAVILCGGLGTRLQAVVSDRPKAMANVAGKPFLEHLLKGLKSDGFESVTLCTGYMSKQIIDYFGDGSSFGMKINYSIETDLMGTGGALKRAEHLLDKEFWVFNGDTIVDIDIKRMAEYHCKHQSQVTMAVVEIQESDRYGNVEFDQRGKVTGFYEKILATGKHFVNAGAYIISKSIINKIPNGFISLERDILPSLVKEDSLYVFKANRFIDIGIPETYFEFKRLKEI